MKVVVTLMARVAPVDRVAAAVTVGAVEDWKPEAVVYHLDITLCCTVTRIFWGEPINQ